MIMVINISNFGDILLSRPAGREAFLMAKAYVFNEERKRILLLSLFILHLFHYKEREIQVSPQNVGGNS